MHSAWLVIGTEPAHKMHPFTAEATICCSILNYLFNSHTFEEKKKNCTFFRIATGLNMRHVQVAQKFRFLLIASK